MACEIVREWLIKSYDEELTSDQNNFIKEHLESCSACRLFVDQVEVLDFNLENHFEVITTELTTKDIMQNLPVRKKKWPLVVASIIVLLSFTFSNELYAFAEKIPLVGDLLNYFSTDDHVKYAEEHGYLVSDFLYTQGDYTLYIKDFYADKDHSEFKLAVEYNNEILIPKSIKIRNDNSSSSINPQSSTQKDPWIDIPRFFSIEFLEDTSTFDFELEFQNKTFTFTDITLEYNSQSYEVKYIVIDQMIETPYGKIELVNLEIHPATMYLNTNHLEVSKNSFYINEMDLYSDGHVISSFLRHTNIDENDMYSYQFEPSLYYEDLDEITLDIGELIYQSQPVIGNINLKDNSFDLNIPGYEIMNLVTVNDEVHFDLKSPIIQSDFDFPNLYYVNERRIPITKSYINENKLLLNQTVEVPYFVLSEWLSKPVTKISYDHHYTIHEKNDLETDDYNSSYSTTVSNLIELLQEYDISIDVKKYFVDEKNTIRLSRGEIEQGLGISIDDLNYTDTEAYKNLQKYLFTTYDFIIDYNDLIIQVTLADLDLLNINAQRSFKTDSIRYSFPIENLETRTLLINKKLKLEIEPIYIKKPEQ